METNKLMELINRFENSELTKLEYKEGQNALLLEKGERCRADVSHAIEQTTFPEPPEAFQGMEIRSPIVGTFYSRPSPESEPFISIGSSVKKGDVVCVVEAMKLFNEVQSEFDGVVRKILVTDGDMVEYNQPLIIIE